MKHQASLEQTRRASWSKKADPLAVAPNLAEKINGGIFVFGKAMRTKFRDHWPDLSHGEFYEARLAYQ